MKSKVSAKGQTVIPKAVRDALGIGPRSVLAWQVRDGVAEVYCIPEDPVRAARGMLRGRGPTIADLLEERRRDRELEARREATLVRQTTGLSASDLACRQAEAAEG